MTPDSSRRAWPAAGLVGIGLAVGCLAATWLPSPASWLAAPAIVAATHRLADRIRRPAPTAGIPRRQASNGVWLSLVLAAAATLLLPAVEPLQRWLVIGGLAGVGVFGYLDHSAGGGRGAGLWATMIGYLAFYLASLLLIDQVAPATSLAGLTGGLAACLVLDQIAPEPAPVRRWIFAWVAGLATAQLALVLGSLPLQPWAEAALLLILAYTGIGLMGQEAAGRLTGRVARAYGVSLAGSAGAPGALGR